MSLPLFLVVTMSWLPSGVKATCPGVLVNCGVSVGSRRFYQRQGFRMRSVERDAFTPATGYPSGLRIDGIELRDRVWLDREVHAEL
jgi:hypothetical protein